ncbi:MAG: 30S ribosomal protein S9 [Elusimicrobia bacterium]|nr:30S ribosomal protein S9 [Candidatus Liberimonas magnetica]
MSQNNTDIQTVMATGRRKTSIARVKVTSGQGKIMVNNRTLDEYFGGLSKTKKNALKPIEMSPSANSYNFSITVTGGGYTGQAGAISHALTRVLIKLDPKLKANLKKEGLLTRDPRMVERKKPGRPKARKRFQFSKR